MKIILFVFALLILGLRINSVRMQSLEGTHIQMEGVVREDAQILATSQYFHLGNYIVFLPKESLVSYGDFVSVEGVVKEGAITKAKVLTHTISNSILSRLHKSILTFIKETLPDPEASLIAGIAFGSNQISPQFKQVLRRSGTSHLIVASGGNLAILGGFLEVVLSRFLKRKVFIPLNAVILFFYSVFVGLGAPIVRAFVMWVVVSIAQLSGRLLSTKSALFYTVFFMIFVRPVWFFEVSFWLSVLATAGIVFFQAWFAKRLRRLSFIGEATATTLAAQLGVLPVSIIVFQSFTPLSVIWNILIGWTVPYIQALGTISAFVALLYEPFGRLFLYTAYPFAWYFQTIVNFS